MMDPVATRFSRMLEQHYASKDELEAAKYEVVRRARKAFSSVAGHFPPTDLAEIARNLGVEEIRHVLLSIDGRLVEKDGRFVVELNKNHSLARQRFTLAHELGHILVSSGGSLGCSTLVSRRGKKSTSDRREEELCNVAAAELLIPSEWAQSFLHDKTPSFETVAELARRCQTSLEVAARRLVDCRQGLCRLLWWEDKGRGTTPCRAYPAYHPATLAQMELVDPDGSVVRKVLRTGKPASGVERVNVEGSVQSYQTDAWSAGRGTVASLLIFGQSRRKSQKATLFEI